MKISTTETHTFINLESGKTCKVISHLERYGDPRLEIVFRGWNPFPCYSMKTSWPVFQKWMTENGWIELNGIDRIIKKEVVN